MAIAKLSGLISILWFFGAAHAEVRINQTQFIGSHNSYKQAMSSSYRAVLGLINADAAKALDYEHIPLEQQLDLGLRKLELDVFYEPEGNRFPVGHIQLIDMNSHCTALRECLERLSNWSDLNPSHAPIWVSFNAKDQQIGWLPDPVPFDAAAFSTMDEVLDAVLGRRIITPNKVKVAETDVPVWPLLTDARGKFLLVLDEGGDKRDLYLNNWRQRPMFVNVAPEHPAAAVMVVNDPIRDFERIQRLVDRGFMVRTRADADTVEARANDSRRMEAALASGAQAVSTDYYLPTNPFDNSYRVQIESGLRCNPVVAPEDCNSSELAP